MRTMRLTWLGVVLQVVVALCLASGVSLLLLRAGPVPMLAALLVQFTLLFFVLLSILRATLTARRLRRHMQGGGWPGGPGPRGPRPDGWPRDLGGTREPRRPFPPHMPPRAAAAEPENAGG
jgi:hypothetical protein